MRNLDFRFDIGERVQIKPINIDGRIIGLRSFNQGNELNVRYFNNGEEKSVWFFEDELEPMKNAR